ncbi:hypothetical protein CYMTET_31157 [Cymbomonas tetramitiformis]|uniref:Uncharacterized protein n=1 Tax=Cymbomonas tetramitiformis TaxID=36881 RepID=A0AAE0KT56_9CHLO|nr:hypothetical protein CYMTET_31157 [Cymbomonas tetramitiformis]
MPLFSEADVHVDGCISPAEYESLSQIIIRRTLLLLHASQGAYPDQVRLQRTSAAHLDTFTPPPVGNLSVVPRFRGRPGNKSYRQGATASAKPWTARGPLTSLEPKRMKGLNTWAFPPGGHFAARYEEPKEPDSSRGSTTLSSHAHGAGLPAEELPSNIGRGLMTNANQTEYIFTTEECGWVNHSGYRDELRCMDGHLCAVWTTDESWSCCNEHGGRYQCPPNYPFMCARDNTCAGGTDYCCESDCSKKGLNRPCHFGCSDVVGRDGALWTDSELQTCEDYYVFQYCNGTGGYGSGWVTYKAPLRTTQMRMVYLG